MSTIKSYIESFYGDVPDALHPIGATRQMITEATKIYLAMEPEMWGDGDSMDRECVRDIMIQKFNLEWK